MRIVLTRDVAGVGVKYDIKNVADGYAMNFLIPNGLAEVATEKRIKEIEATKKELEAEEKSRLEYLAKALMDIKKITLEIKVAANEKGHLFKGITAFTISNALKSQADIALPKEALLLEAPIKETGEFLIPIDVANKKGKLKLVVSKK